MLTYKIFNSLKNDTITENELIDNLLPLEYKRGSSKNKCFSNKGIKFCKRSDRVGNPHISSDLIFCACILQKLSISKYGDK